MGQRPRTLFTQIIASQVEDVQPTAFGEGAFEEVLVVEIVAQGQGFEGLERPQQGHQRVRAVERQPLEGEGAKREAGEYGSQGLEELIVGLELRQGQRLEGSESSEAAAMIAR